MLIKAISIKNFRCFQDQYIELDPLTAILGRNGSGKSTILSALEIFYDVGAPVNEDDFYNRDTSQIIEIQVNFSEFRDGAERDEFAPYIRDGLMGVKKVIRWSNNRAEQKYYASIRQIPQFAEIRSMSGKTNQVNRWNEMVDNHELPDLGSRLPQRGADLEGAMNAYEAAHPEQMQWVDKEEQFFGPKNIGGGKLDKYTKFVRVPAVRDVMVDMADKRGSPLFQLLDMLVMRRINARADVRQLKIEFGERIRSVYRSENLTELAELANGITSTLQILVPNSRLNLRWAEAKIPEIPNPAYYSELEEDEFAGAIDRKGHGLQRALIFSLLQHLAVASPVEVTTDDNAEVNNPDITPITAVSVNGISGKPSEVEIGRSISNEAIYPEPDLILAIDEPELYQHPLRSRHLASVLRKMTQEPQLALGVRNQVIYTTHSPYFVDLGYFNQLRIVRKCKNEGLAPCASASQYQLFEASQEMARITGKKPEDFTADTFYVRTYPVMTVAVNEGFFADVVVLVEGLTEVAVLSRVAEIINAPWLVKGVAIIPVDGKNNIDRAAVIFRGLCIPTYIVFDGDVRHKGKKDENKEVKTNRSLLALVGVEPEDFPKDGAYPIHACFEDELETYIQSCIGEDEFRNLRDEIADKFGYDRPNEVLKNFDVCSEFVSRIYVQGKRLPLIEEIVIQASKLIQI